MNYYVVYQTCTTMKQIGKPEVCQSKKEAESKAKDYNRYNKDNTWNHVFAYVIRK